MGSLFVWWSGKNHQLSLWLNAGKADGKLLVEMLKNVFFPPIMYFYRASAPGGSSGYTEDKSLTLLKDYLLAKSDFFTQRHYVSLLDSYLL